MNNPEQRFTELETRLSFLEHGLQEISDALAQSRMENYRQSELLKRTLDELKSLRTQMPGDAGVEPPPPHY
jgi:SlyX protein